MLSDLLLAIGLLFLTAASFLFSPVLGLVLCGVGCLIGALALSDGKGFSWRS